ncbi:glycerol uptake facilitator protein [Arthrobacter subterraneus]|uniref:Glycerol uptake facilitator protein n=1 Tax=Arthrobacter subterraneus TaxID=335973 RepID=A0A1G8EV06_9MICC|nr:MULTISPECIES: MIP/aquaporin family protein [Arthrobacter]SDH73647.1 glycerol uptake facilitator protein [Arthrobacter subterraneus]
MSLEVFVAETFGTFMLLLLGTGVVANVALAGTKGNNGGFLMVNFGWGLAVFAGVYVAALSGAHLNFAVTVGLWANGDVGEFAPGVDKNLVNALAYFAAQMLGSILGAVGCWLAYKQHFDEEPDPANKLGVFSTGPAIRNYGWNLVTEVIGTFVLVFVILAFASTPSGLGPLAVALLVVGIGASLGGPTGYAINPNRDLGPRIAHAFLPIRGKGSSDWSYAWVPVVGPIIGGLLGGLVAMMVTFPAPA